MSENQTPEMFETEEIQPDHGWTKRGVAWWDTTPPLAWLKSNTSFSHRTEDGLRITFRKKEREGNRADQWNAFTTRKGTRKAKANYDTVTVYARISENLSLPETVERMRNQLKEVRKQSRRVERNEIKPEDTTRPTDKQRRQQKVEQEMKERKDAGQMHLEDQPGD